MAKVPYNMDNCMKCLCPSCAVQAKSDCIMDKRRGWQKMMIHEAKMKKSMPAPKSGSMAMGMGEEMEMMAPEDMIGLYCTAEVGKSRCGDLDSDQLCTCPGCAVWQENGLKTQYYCLKGSADELG